MLIVVSLLLLVVGIVDATRQTQESFRLVTHSAEVLRSTYMVMSNIRNAESGQRGFIVTHNPGFSQSFDREIEQAREAYGKLFELTKNDPVQHQHVQDMGVILEERIELMRTPLELARQGQFDRARAVIVEGRGFDTMSQLELAAEQFANAERNLQATRVASSERRLRDARTLALIGGPMIAFLSALVSFVTVRRIRQPISKLSEAMGKLGLSLIHI